MVSFPPLGGVGASVWSVVVAKVQTHWVKNAEHGLLWVSSGGVGFNVVVLSRRGPGGWAPLLAGLTLQCAAKPHWWHGGRPAHIATHRVNVRIGGLRQPPNRPPCTRRVIINLLETPRHHFHCTQHSFRASHVIHSCHNSQSVIHRHQRKAGSHGLFSSIPSP